MAADVALVKANLLRWGVEANHIEMMTPFLHEHEDWLEGEVSPEQAIANFGFWDKTAEGGHFWEKTFFDYEGGLYVG